MEASSHRSADAEGALGKLQKLMTDLLVDNLWMVAWLFSLVALLGAKLTARRAWLGGLLLGATLATSLKTVLMIPALALGVAVTLGLRRRGCGRLFPDPGWRTLGWVLAGMAVVPGAIVLVASVVPQSLTTRGVMPVSGVPSRLAGSRSRLLGCWQSSTW